MVGGWFPLRRDRKTNPKNKLNIRFFRLDTLRRATNDFSSVIGRGGFGSVFKGVLPDDGRTVAIKRNLKRHDGFLEMVDSVSRLHHINLIQVIGCCVEKGEQILVCEFADNGSVFARLHANDGAPAFDWETRAAVCIGTARGLCYLHEEINPPLIHRDIKPSNILLDANWVPKISDFDLMSSVNGKPTAKASCGGEFTDLDGASTVTTNVKGTVGYLDPNYLFTGELTEKVDVYSFGLTILEIVTGRRAVDLNPEESGDRMILSWVTRVMREDAVSKIIDPKLTGFPEDEVERFVNVALLCTRATSELRPTMFEVVHMLRGTHIFDRDISEMALGAIADQPQHWSSAESMSSMAFSVSGNAEDRDSSSSMGVARQEGEEFRSIAPKRTNAAETRLGRCREEDQSCPEDVVREYFERSMEKIMRFHVAMHRGSNRRTIAMKQQSSSSEHMFMEAVYPPFLSGEYRTSRVRYSQEENSGQLL